jgi:hypothetical protein
MSDRSKCRGQTKCSPWSSRLGVGSGANDHASEKFAVTNPWRRPRPTQGCSASEEEDIERYRLQWRIAGELRTIPDIATERFVAWPEIEEKL